MQSVGKLDKHDSDVLCHSYEHLAKTLRLLLNLIRIKRELGELGDSVYEQSYIISELLSYLIEGHIRILDYIMQKGSYHSVLIHAYLCNNNGSI